MFTGISKTENAGTFLAMYAIQNFCHYMHYTVAPHKQLASTKLAKG